MAAHSDATDFSAAEFRRRAEMRLHAQQPALDLAAGSHGGDHILWSKPLSTEALAAAAGAAVLVPVVAHRGGATILLTRRSRKLRNHSGQIAFPGGRIDKGETAMAAALREADEEIGLNGSHVEPIGFMDYYFTGTGYRITPVVAMIHPPFELAINPHEVDEAFEVPLEFLMQPANHQRVTRKDDGRTFLAMPFGERYIWGATAGILRHLYERLYG